MKKAAIFRHPRYDEVFLGVVGEELRACSMTEGLLGSFDVNECDRLCAAYEAAATRSQGINDLAEFFEDITTASFRQGLILGEIFSMCVEAIASAFHARGVEMFD